MNAQISWARRPAAMLGRRGGMLKCLGLPDSILAYLSDTNAGMSFKQE